MLIRKATIADAPKISYLIQNNTQNNPNNYTPIQIKVWKACNTTSKIKAQLANRELFCAFVNHKLIGTIGVDNNEIVGFYVSYTQRKKGIGIKLLQFAEDYIQNKGFQKILLTATPSAFDFYTKNGFQLLQKITVTLDSVTYEEFTMQKTI